MKVLVSDNLGEAGIKMFEEDAGFEVDVNTGLEPDELKKIIGNYEPPKISRWWGGPGSVWITSIYRLLPNGACW
jgi:hypothetical protein